MIPDRSQRIRIAAESSVDERSILRAYRGEPVREATRKRVSAAATTLGLPPPPDKDADLAAQSVEMEALAARIREEMKRILPLLPGIDPHDLGLILDRKFRVWGKGQRFFIHRFNGHYVF